MSNIGVEALKLAGEIFAEHPEILGKKRMAKCKGGYYMPPGLCSLPHPRCSGCEACPYYEGKGG